MNKFLKLFGYFIFSYIIVILVLYAFILGAAIIGSLVLWNLIPLYIITSMLVLRLVLIVGFLSTISHSFTDEGKESYKKFIAIFEKNDTL
jgi:hypothetical protein